MTHMGGMNINNVVTDILHKYGDTVFVAGSAAANMLHESNPNDIDLIAYEDPSEAMELLSGYVTWKSKTEFAYTGYVRSGNIREDDTLVQILRQHSGEDIQEVMRGFPFSAQRFAVSNRLGVWSNHEGAGAYHDLMTKTLDIPEDYYLDTFASSMRKYLWQKGYSVTSEAIRMLENVYGRDIAIAVLFNKSLEGLVEYPVSEEMA